MTSPHPQQETDVTDARPDEGKRRLPNVIPCDTCGALDWAMRCPAADGRHKFAPRLSVWALELPQRLPERAEAQWWTGDGFSRDFSAAVQFRSQTLAESALGRLRADYIVFDGATAIEHGWLDTRSEAALLDRIASLEQRVAQGAAEREALRGELAALQDYWAVYHPDDPAGRGARTQWQLAGNQQENVPDPSPVALENDCDQGEEGKAWLGYCVKWGCEKAPLENRDGQGVCPRCESSYGMWGRLAPEGGK